MITYQIYKSGSKFINDVNPSGHLKQTIEGNDDQNPLSPIEPRSHNPRKGTHCNPGSNPNIIGRREPWTQQHPKTKGRNHHHTATKQKTIAHSGNKGGKLQSSDQQHPKTKGGNNHHTATKQKPLHTVETRVENSSQVTNNTAKSQEQRAKSKGQRAKSRELRAES